MHKLTPEQLRENIRESKKIWAMKHGAEYHRKRYTEDGAFRAKNRACSREWYQRNKDRLTERRRKQKELLTRAAEIVAAASPLGPQ